MTGTLTIRLTSELRRKLSAKSRALGATPSAVARATLEAALDVDEGTTLGERTARQLGTIFSRAIPAGRDARQALADWAPDRRG